MMVPLDIAREFVAFCTHTELSLEEDAPAHCLGPAGPCAPPVLTPPSQDLAPNGLFRKYALTCVTQSCHRAAGLRRCLVVVAHGVRRLLPHIALLGRASCTELWQLSEALWGQESPSRMP